MNPQDELNALTGLFGDGDTIFQSAVHIPSALTPEPYKRMLVHDHHMTVTMENYHKSAVDVRIIEQVDTEELYCRKIVLLKTGTDDVVQFGIVRFNFHYVTDDVRAEIVEGETPLGRVLIKHNVLRHIDLGAIIRVTAGDELAGLLQMETGDTTFGRLATIFCNECPAVDLLEVSAPLVSVEASHADPC